MAMDIETLKVAFPQAVPMVGTLALDWVELTPEKAVMVLPDQKAYHNHIAGPHAGAMFTLGESASGALVMLNFGDQLDKLVPLAVSASIKYLKVAMGSVIASAVMSRTVSEIEADLEAGIRPEFAVDIEITDGAGTVTGAMTVLWTLKTRR